MGRNTGKVGWDQLRKCLKGYSKEPVVVKGQKKEVVRGGERRKRSRAVSEMLRRKVGP